MYSEDDRNPCLGDLIWKYLSMPPFGRCSRAGGDMGSKSLSCSHASFKGAPIVYATQKSEGYGPDARARPQQNGRITTLMARHGYSNLGTGSIGLFC